MRLLLCIYNESAAFTVSTFQPRARRLPESSFHGCRPSSSSLPPLDFRRCHCWRLSFLAVMDFVLGFHECSRKEMRRCATVKEKMSFGPTTTILGTCQEQHKTLVVMDGAEFVHFSINFLQRKGFSISGTHIG